jgi:TatD DNase family protein
MSPRYLDVHCHVQFPWFEEDRGALLARMREHGVGGIVVGCDLESSKKAVALAERHDNLWAAIGLHPNEEGNEWYEAKNYLELGTSAKVVAIGECGLDYYRPAEVDEKVKKLQKSILNNQIELAARLDKPLIIHARPSKGAQDAYQDLIAILTEAKKKYPRLAGDIHFFVGGIEEMRALHALGFTTSFTAVITFARDYDAVIKAAPLEMILAETDSPFVAPAARRGQRNDPLAVIDVAAQIAAIRGEDLELVRAALLANAKRVFCIT